MLFAVVIMLERCDGLRWLRDPDDDPSSRWGIGLGVVRLSVHVYVLACIWLEAFCDLLAVDL